MNCRKDMVVFDEFRGEYICAETGEVIEERMVDVGKEWRSFSALSNRERGEIPNTLKVHDMGLHTEIDTSTLIGRKLSELNSMSRVVSGRERKLSKALKLSNEVINKLSAPGASRLKEEVGLVLRRLVKNGALGRKRLGAFVAASIICAAENLNIPVDAKKVLNYCGTTMSDVWNALIKIKRDLGIAKSRCYDPRTLVLTYAQRAGLHSQVATLAIRVVEAGRASGTLLSKGPHGVAVASLYVASILLDARKTQSAIARDTEVSEVTIRNRYKDVIDGVLIEVCL
ncbi:MAG: transcription initiation factor IIB family protein [Sulfolobales archaeon]|nr:transcription initiation factor IIB family protein [Sulfolobales archaeon]